MPATGTVMSDGDTVVIQFLDESGCLQTRLVEHRHDFHCGLDMTPPPTLGSPCESCGDITVAHGDRWACLNCGRHGGVAERE